MSALISALVSSTLTPKALVGGISYRWELLAEIREALGCSKATARDLLDEMEESGIVSVDGIFVEVNA